MLLCCDFVYTRGRNESIICHWLSHLSGAIKHFFFFEGLVSVSLSLTQLRRAAVLSVSTLALQAKNQAGQLLVGLLLIMAVLSDV